MRDVAVVGANMLKFGRYPDKDVVRLASEALLGALKDAGITIQDVEILVSGNLYQSNAMIGQRIMKEVGATGIPVINVANACATGSTAFREAYYAIASGAYDIAVAVGSEQMGKMGLLGGGGGGDRAYSTEGVMGTGIMPGVFGQAGVEHMRKYGTTQEQIAKIGVKASKHGEANPYAMYRQGKNLEEIMNARVVAWPNTLFMCCPTSDGAAAAVLMSAEKAKQYTTKPVWVAASALSSDPYTERNPTMFDINTVTRIAAKEAYEKSGIGPKDLNMVELHDCFATAELVHYENLGLCADGEAGKLIDDKETYNGGKIPVNVSGGLLSKGHPLGATGVANIVEIVWHLREEAGDRQVKGAKTGLAHVIGLGSACTIHVLKR
jgi:acetyl-CoA acetyltransferase